MARHRETWNDLSWKYYDRANTVAPFALDAFGRTRVSDPVTLFDSKQIFDAQPLQWDDQEVSGAGTGTTYSQDRASSVLDVSATTAGKRIRQTFFRPNYLPGKSQEIMITGILGATTTGITAGMGQYDDENGLFALSEAGSVSFVVRSNVTGSAVDTKIAQADWNADTMDGTGGTSNPSGITLDLSKTQILFIDYEWLGVGSVRFGWVVNGVIYICHRQHHSNSTTSVYMSTPNNPLRYELENDGTGAASTMECICGTVISEGGADPEGLRFSEANSTVVNANTANLIYALVGIRLRAASKGCTIVIEDLSVLCTSITNFEWRLYLNPTVAEASWAYTAITNSCVDSALAEADNPSTNLITGGTILARGFGASKSEISLGVEQARHPGVAIDGTTFDTIVLAVKPLAVNAKVYGAMNWRELQ